MKKSNYTIPQNLDQEQRRRTGSFYTPEPLADLMTATALQGKILPLRILDYSCGGGAFLAGVLRYIRRNCPEKLQSSATSLYGIDINPEAIAIARQNCPEIPEQNFIVADALNADLPFGGQKFDLILGNPPYRCGGVRQSSSFSKSEQLKLKQRYPDSFEYKMSMFALFIELASRWSYESCLIVPDSILVGKYFSKLRRFMLNNHSIKGIYLLEKPEFDAAPGNGVILHFAHKDPEDDGTFPVYRFPPRAELKLPEKMYRQKSGDFLNTQLSRLQLSFSGREEELYRKVQKDALPLAQAIRFYSGIIARNGKNSLISQAGSSAILYGREVTPFALKPEGFRITPAPAKIKSGLKPDYSRPKILLRQTGTRLIAALDKQGFYALNNCHVGMPAGNIPPETITALLNSTVLNFCYRHLSAERCRNMGQIDIDLLNTLPLRHTPEYDLFAARCAVEPECRNDLDRKTAELYGLDDEDMEWMKKEMML